MEESVVVALTALGLVARLIKLFDTSGKIDEDDYDVFDY